MQEKRLKRCCRALDNDETFYSVFIVLQEEGELSFRCEDSNVLNWPTMRNKAVIVPASSKH